MKWKLLTVAAMMILAGGVSMALLAKDEKFEQLSPRRQPVADPAFGEPSDFDTDARIDFSGKFDTAKERFLRLASEYAQDGDDLELERMADDLQKKINERDARRKVQEVRQLLQFVVEKFPETAAGKEAKTMLDTTLPTLQAVPEESAAPDQQVIPEAQVVPEKKALPEEKASPEQEN